MNTRRKNKSAHPGIPDMTPSQLSSAGLSRTPAAGGKKLTKNAQIVALQDEVRSLRELISSVTCFILLPILHYIYESFHFLEPF